MALEMGMGGWMEPWGVSRGWGQGGERFCFGFAAMVGRLALCEAGGPQNGWGEPGPQPLQAFSLRPAERSCFSTGSCLSSLEGTAEGFCASSSYL